jgi:hypothetical protein
MGEMVKGVFFFLSTQTFGTVSSSSSATDLDLSIVSMPSPPLDGHYQAKIVFSSYIESRVHSLEPKAE